MNALVVPALLAQVKQELLLATRLYELLAQELAALERLDVESIQALAKEKNKLLIALDEQCALREKQFPDIFSSQELNLLSTGVSRSLSNELAHLVEDYRSLLRHCQTQNEINGRIISLNRRSVERQLSMMRGSQPDSMIYNARGGATRVNGRLRHAVA